MKVKITKCSDSLMWYSKHIGETYHVIKDYSKESNEYLVRASDGYLNIIRVYDCEIVRDTVKETLAMLAVSGITPSPFGIDLMNKISNGEITKEEALFQIKEHYENTSTH